LGLTEPEEVENNLVPTPEEVEVNTNCCSLLVGCAETLGTKLGWLFEKKKTKKKKKKKKKNSRRSLLLGQGGARVKGVAQRALRGRHRDDQKHQKHFFLNFLIQKKKKKKKKKKKEKKKKKVDAKTWNALTQPKRAYDNAILFFTTTPRAKKTKKKKKKEKKKKKKKTFSPRSFQRTRDMKRRTAPRQALSLSFRTNQRQGFFSKKKRKKKKKKKKKKKVIITLKRNTRDETTRNNQNAHL
jgi:hypothetical protein